jgi:UDP-glucose 4-epimerase
MNYLLIGGNGFIGSHFIDILINNNHKVRVFDFQMEKFRTPNKRVDYRIHSFDDIENLESALDNIDIVIHLASATVPSNSNDKALLEIDKILKPSIILFDLLVKKNISKIVYFSSGGAVYGNVDKNTIDEATQFNPISSYGIIKSTLEYYLNLYQRIHGLNSLIIRPSNPYGPRQNNIVSQGVISTFLRKKFQKEDLLIFGNLDIRKDYIYIDDLINITYRLIENDLIGVFNVGSGLGTTLNEIIEVINILDKEKVNLVIQNSLSSDVSSFVLDINKTTNYTNYPPKVNIKEGIISTWNWISENS